MAQKTLKLKLKNWYSSKYQIVSIQRNVLFFISFISICTVLIAIIFVKQIISSKSVVPYVIEVEEKTGIPIVVDQLNESHFTANAVLKRYFIFSFLKIAEGYNPATFKDDYQKLMLFSSATVFRQIQKKITPRNPKSPVALISNRGMIKVLLKSISFTTPTSVVVRYRLQNVGRVYGIENNRDMIADISFRFANLNLTLTERYINPLGFQVTKFVNDRELVSTYEEKK